MRMNTSIAQGASSLIFPVVCHYQIQEQDKGYHGNQKPVQLLQLGVQ